MNEKERNVSAGRIFFEKTFSHLIVISLPIAWLSLNAIKFFLLLATGIVSASRHFNQELMQDNEQHIKESAR
jgi:hypothetical protein